ncbi:ATP-dependent helicase HrpB [Pseudomonas chlororaphis]|uniref:ATP-dependent helicase HrpB n=1 Tax=Pseudomonas chlororaphis TaxID=587753 RepID=UPI0007B31C5D|nr:ATP-dependent helicase HrpB [Pseudomonas chlororaphis]AZC59715.1 ATP-dependent helicase HrpB [Pseudomonas chlororaphis subsp. piscium]AZC65896.1 ATP-dependent helicase HrpB [Pseudomonas chlororaphis subsp. piscium]AZC72122.1 ATP-dependent helicase HrpB [Pseudomonas chlororaphis subsp. piscium]AZC78376.1 ATP-dependent helicase HrpB [Pseudomonas chlororaphis subsp. piscium]AZC91993.1 ATP-dependent helicase HrpB [Pseudomonas chlororaphis subsp. piscium]
MNSLPIDEVLPALREALATRHEAVLEAPPGAGKTTRVPLALLNEPWLAGQRILMLEPRRLAARAAAERLASELGEKVGETVGYRIRLDSKVGPNTRIEVVTEGILTRRLQDDPALEGVGLLIFDEFHERSLDADLALALSLNGRDLFRDEQPLKILLMSATLEGERLAGLLDDAPILRSEGRMFPVDVRWGRPFQPGEFIEPRLVQTIVEALNDESGSVLVFLPGQAEIRRVHQQLADAVGERPEILLCPLHGELDLAAQRAAIEPAPPGQRKVVLATNIAETSLTIDGVRVVVDAGLARVPRFDPGSGMTRLDTQRVSRASATQRAGRAGRLEPGVCYRLWSQDQHEQLAAYGSAEILQADLAGLALQLARWGVTPAQLVWLDVPPGAAYAQAQDLLERLGALTAKAGEDWKLTPHGQAMAELPAHPRIAHLLLRGQALGLANMACDVAALLGERDILRGGGADLHSRLVLLSGEERAARGAQGGVQRARQLARQYRGYLRGQPSQAVADPDHPRWLGALLALAYPDRVAQQRRPGGAEYRLANGRAALFSETDSLMKQPWLVIADLGSRQGQREERIYLAADFDPALFDSVLAEQVRSVDQLDWDEREGVLRAERQRKVGELVLSREPLTGLDEAARCQALVNLVRRKGLELLPWTPELRQWQARVALLRQLDLEAKGESEWPDVSDAALLKSLESWLLPYLGKVSRLSHFANLELAGIVHNLLPWPLPQRLDELAPHHLRVPSGSSIRLDYSEQPPILAVRLQELFGLAETPRIAGGRQVVKLHLLSPARRPVQVTQDLANFWRSTYAEVKKDLKGRYPKHYWPDDPLVAEATARAKPRK